MVGSFVLSTLHWCRPLRDCGIRISSFQVTALISEYQHTNSRNQGPRSKFSSGGAKEECVKENFGGGAGGGACLWISIQFL